jgi:uncharacterized protein YdaU (DUF1376 family)
MSQTPFMQLYIGDYLADTRHLTTEQHGAYLLLLMALWRSGGSLPNEPAKLARVVAAQARRWPAIWEGIAEFFTVEDGRISNSRLSRELAKASEKSRVRAASGAQGGRAKALNAKEAAVANATVLPQHSSEPESEVREEGKPSSRARARAEPSGFSAFWDAYPHRGGVKKGRKPSLEAYCRALDRGAVEVAILAGARAAHGDPQVQRGFARDPTTWLNQAGWEDEIGPPNIIGFPPSPPSSQRNRSSERLAAWLDAARDAPEPGMARGSDRDPPQALLRG